MTLLTRARSEQYQCAGKWLDSLTVAIKCKKTDVQIVPGNHDIDREKISKGCELMLNEIITNGESVLDAILEDEGDREVLYRRFEAYRPFAEGYDCPLDSVGGVDKKDRLELAPGRSLCFVGLNSALICSNEDEKGRLLLGTRQHILPREPGQELIVLCHHPLEWLRDSDKARNYIRSRARVFVCGHDHEPSVNIESVNGNGDLVILSAGATIPPNVSDDYNYTYNLLIFDWNTKSDRLKMTIVPRAWRPETTCFDADLFNFDKPELIYELDCPNFQTTQGDTLTKQVTVVAPAIVEAITEISHVEATLVDEFKGGDTMADSFPLLLLRFFRDLTPDERVSVFMEVGVLPNEWHELLTHNIERQLLDALVKAGRLAELEVAINKIEAQRKENT